MCPKWIAGALAAIVLPFGLAAHGLAQTDVKLLKREQIKSWTYVCLETTPEADGDPVQQCRINSQLWTKADKPKLFSAVVILVPEPGAQPVLTLRLPGGIPTEQKVRMQVDKKPALLSPPVACSGGGCHAVMSMSKAQIDQMKSGNKLGVTFKGPKGKDIKTEFSLLGFTGAFGALVAGGA